MLYVIENKLMSSLEKKLYYLLILISHLLIYKKKLSMLCANKLNILIFYIS